MKNILLIWVCETHKGKFFIHRVIINGYNSVAHDVAVGFAVNVAHDKVEGREFWHVLGFGVVALGRLLPESG